MEWEAKGGLRYRPHTRIDLKGHPTLNEKWLQRQIVEDPSRLGLGELFVRDIERQQPRSGRLDLLLADPDGTTRYEVELQLGATDETHIIRTIEYWDSERRRYPQYEHIAVLVAEDITSRFFNVISLFNGFIPIIAIHLSAIRISDEEMTLVFTKILDHATLGTDEEDAGEPTDRPYWIGRSSSEMLSLVDRIYELVSELDPGVELGYRKHYIGLHKNGIATNYVKMAPRKKQVNLYFPTISQSDEVTNLIEESGLNTLDYSNRSGYRPIIRSEDLSEHRELLRNLIERAQKNYRM
ncbi:hypothetical protein [Candidatus Poriferisocius sp.]|uniref:hypothetical protein n=1 Tax=Candidatus Poriferisocius sp. TaxID=3101276 RepID=UPI003B01122A